MKIGVHLTFNGSRRRASLQVIDLVRPCVFSSIPKPEVRSNLLFCARIPVAANVR